MKKNDVFEFTAPGGYQIPAVVINDVARYLNYRGRDVVRFLCYAQNRLFLYTQEFSNGKLVDVFYSGVVVEYVVLPEYDAILENYQHQLDMADDYASKEL